jgi:hypothetical protein
VCILGMVKSFTQIVSVDLALVLQVGARLSG